MDIENLHKHVGLADGNNGSVKVHVGGQHVATVYSAAGGYQWQPNQSFFTSIGVENAPYHEGPVCGELHVCVADALGKIHELGGFGNAVDIPDDSNVVSEGHGEKSPEMPLVKFNNKKPKGGDETGLHGLEDYMALKDKKEKKMTNEEMTAMQMAKRERIVKGLKKSKADFVKRYGKDATSVMYATATKQAMKEEVELVEGKIDKEHPIVKEYDALKKNDIGTLRGLIKQQHRIVDTSGYKTKDHAISAYLRTKHGDKKVDAAFGFNKEVELDEGMKPYVSGDHKDGWSILNSKGKEVKKFHHSDYTDHPIADKKSAAKNDAMAYLKKHFNKLSEGVEAIDEKKDPCWKGYKKLGMKNKGGKQVPNCIPEQEIKEEGEVLGGADPLDPTSKIDRIARADYTLSDTMRKKRKQIVIKRDHKLV